MTTVTITKRIMMNDDVKKIPQFILIFVGNGPHAETIDGKCQETGHILTALRFIRPFLKVLNMIMLQLLQRVNWGNMLGQRDMETSNRVRMQ